MFDNVYLTKVFVIQLLSSHFSCIPFDMYMESQKINQENRTLNTSGSIELYSEFRCMALKIHECRWYCKHLNADEAECEDPWPPADSLNCYCYKNYELIEGKVLHLNMDLIMKLDHLLTTTEINCNLNEDFYMGKNKLLLQENIAEKEDDAKTLDLKDNYVESESKNKPRLENEIDSTEEFEDCVVYDNSDSSESSEDSITIDDINSEKLEKFIKECETLSDEQSDEEDTEEHVKPENETTKQENTDNIEDEPRVDLEPVNLTIEPTTLNDSTVNIEPQSTDDDSNTTVETENDFKVLENRINTLWKEIEDLQVQIKEEKEFSREVRSEIKEYINNYHNQNPDNSNVSEEREETEDNEVKMIIEAATHSATNFTNYTNDIEQGLEKTEELTDKLSDITTPETEVTMSDVSTNCTFDIKHNSLPDLTLSAKTEAKISARKEILKRIRQNESKTESYMFTRKLKEVEELCTSEMNKITTIISQLDSLQYDNEFRNNHQCEGKPRKFNSNIGIRKNLNYHSDPAKKLSNISLPDPTKLKYLPSDVKFESGCSEDEISHSVLEHN